MKRSKLILIVLLLVSVLPVIIMAFLGLPLGDDFANWTSLHTANRSFLQCIDYVKYVYNNWQGTYTGSLLCSIPVYKSIGLVGIRLEYLITVILFVLCFTALISKLCERAGYDKTQTLVVLLLGQFYLLNCSYIREVFYWHTGIAVYTIPLVLTLFTLKLFIECKGWKETMTASLVAFIAAGGALNVTALLCVMLLSFIIVERINAEKLLKWETKYFIFIIAVLGGVVNATAPGNFVRAKAFSENVSIVTGLVGALLRAHVLIKTSVMEVWGIFLALTAFGISYYSAEKTGHRCKRPLIVIILGWMTLVITDFPVMLGYHIGADSERAMPGRCYFVERLAFVLVVLIVSAYIGVYVKKNCELRLSKEWFFGAGITVALLLYLVVSPSEIVQLRMTKSLLSSRLYSWIDSQERILVEAKNDASDTLLFTIEEDLFPEDSYVPSLGLESNPYGLENVEFATFFEKKEVVLDKS